MEWFKPKGDVPEWRKIYDVLVEKAVDEVLTYDEITAILGRPFNDDRAPVYRANQELLAVHKRATVNERGVGYRVARANEHVGLALKHRARARRSMTKAVQIADGTDRSQLTLAERKYSDAVEVNLRAQAAMLRRIERRPTPREPVYKEEEELQQDNRLDLLLADLRRKGLITELDIPGIDG